MEVCSGVWRGVVGCGGGVAVCACVRACVSLIILSWCVKDDGREQVRNCMRVWKLMSE